MYEKSIKLLKTSGVEFENGLTCKELQTIKNIYGVIFPNSLKLFLMNQLPVSKGFYNWRNFTKENIAFITKAIEYPIRYIENYPDEVYWCDDWGDEPKNVNIFAKEVKKRILNAPKVVPIYEHRYMPMVKNENPPILSIHGIDVIYYGQNLEDYFRVEFGVKNQNAIDFNSIEPILFWSDIM